MLLAFSIWVIALIGWKPNRMWLTAAISLALATVTSAFFVVQIVHGTYAAGSVLDSLWLGAGLLLVYAAWQPHDDALPVKLEGSRRLGATSAAATAALAVLVVGQFLSVGFAAVTLAAATLVALIARAAVSFKESLQMFADARIEAQTDSLTGLGNRRKLMTDLRRELQLASVASPRVLVLFDLDGFKRYNDTYGHPAGDVLLARLGANLGRAMKPYGGAYRVGGDEFCVLVMTGASSAKTIIALAAAALSEQGEGFAIKASHGAVILPHEARDATAGDADRRPAHVRAQGGPALLGDPSDARHPAAGPAGARTRPGRAPEGRRTTGAWESAHGCPCSPRSWTRSCARPSCTTSARWRSRTRSCASPAP